MAINNPVVTDSTWLQDTALAIQEKDGGGKIEVPDFAGRIRSIPTQDNALLNSLINRSITSIENSEVTSIGVGTFYNCTNLSIVILGKRATLSNSNAFSGTDNAITYVQPEDLSWYSTATNWSALYTAGRVKSIEDLTGDDLIWYQEQLAKYPIEEAS